MSRLWGDHPSSRRVWGKLIPWTSCALFFDLKDSFGVDLSFRPISVTDLDLGTFHVED